MGTLPWRGWQVQADSHLEVNAGVCEVRAYSEEAITRVLGQEEVVQIFQTRKRQHLVSDWIEESGKGWITRFLT